MTVVFHCKTVPGAKSRKNPRFLHTVALRIEQKLCQMYLLKTWQSCKVFKKKRMHWSTGHSTKNIRICALKICVGVMCQVGYGGFNVTCRLQSAGWESALARGRRPRLTRASDGKKLFLWREGFFFFFFSVSRLGGAGSAEIFLSSFSRATSRDYLGFFFFF